MKNRLEEGWIEERREEKERMHGLPSFWLFDSYKRKRPGINSSKH
jgi:hypothetical protein